MVQGLLDGNRSELGVRRVEEWPTRSSQPDALNLVHASAAQALMDGVVFAVNRKQWLALPASLGRDQLPRGDQTLLIRQPQGFSRAHRFIGCLQAGHADDGADHEVNFRMRRD